MEKYGVRWHLVHVELPKLLAAKQAVRFARMAEEWVEGDIP